MSAGWRRFGLPGTLTLVSLFWIGCCVLLLVGCQAPAMPPGDEVKVQRVVSGQSLEVLLPDRQPSATASGQVTTERVRLIGIDAPALEQEPWGAAAQAWLAQLLDGQVVILESDVLPSVETEDYSQRLAYVWQDGVLVNERLVAEGYALVVSRSPNLAYDERLMRAQERARAMGLGIWNPNYPMRQTPAEFRSQQKR